MCALLVSKLSYLKLCLINLGFSYVLCFVLQDIQFQGKELREAPAPLGYH